MEENDGQCLACGRETRRMYTSGWRWCVWRWTDVVVDDRLYLRRLHLLQTPWFSVMLHWLTPDTQEHLHDHPVAFLSMLVKGSFIESLPAEDDGHSIVVHVDGKFLGRWALRRWWHFKRATDMHRIVWCSKPCVTLVLAGPVTRQWGFHVPGRGWVPWREYNEEQRKEKP